MVVAQALFRPENLCEPPRSCEIERCFVSNVGLGNATPRKRASSCSAQAMLENGGLAGLCLAAVGTASNARKGEVPMENILDMTNLAFGGDAVKRLSSVLHESPSATQRGVETALPTSLASLAAFASSESKAAELLGAFRGGNYPHADAGDITRLVGDPGATTRLAQSGSGFMSQMFGGKFSGIVEALAGQAGVSRSSATTLLGLAAPLVLNAISKETQSQNFDAQGLSRFLGDQGRKVSGLLPGPLSSALSALGPGMGAGVGAGESASKRVLGRASEEMHRVREVGAGVTERVSDVAHRAAGEIEPRTNPMWLILPLALLALLGLWLFNRARTHERRLDQPAMERSYEQTPNNTEPYRPNDTNQDPNR